MNSVMITPGSFPKGPKAICSDDSTLGKGNEYHILGELLDTLSESISVPRETNATMALPVWVEAQGVEVINGVLAKVQLRVHPSGLFPH